jgi:hypothetical protein
MNLKLPIILLSLLLFSSCRQEIVPPDNPVGNINEPNLTRTSNSYIFSINAKNMTTTVTDDTFLNTFRARINSIIADHTSGSVQIKLQNYQDNILYSVVFDDNTNGSSSNINGQQPQKIMFVFNNFTGKLKVTLTNVQ